MDAYLWTKALHVVAVISWMAGMLYLPRLYVYHAGATTHPEPGATFKVMERRLLRAIITPAMLVTLVTGLALAHLGGWWRAPWLHGKLLLVVAMLGVHGVLAARRKAFEADRNTRSPRYYRVLNEVPTVLLIGIVVLVIVKPFG